MVASASADPYSPFHPHTMPAEDGPQSSEEGSGLHSPVSFGAPYATHGDSRKPLVAIASFILLTGTKSGILTASTTSARNMTSAIRSPNSRRSSPALCSIRPPDMSPIPATTPCNPATNLASTSLSNRLSHTVSPPSPSSTPHISTSGIPPPPSDGCLVDLPRTHIIGSLPLPRRCPWSLITGLRSCRPRLSGRTHPPKQRPALLPGIHARRYPPLS